MVALDVAQRLERKLRESQLKTVMTRSSDVFIPLDERVSIENSQKNAIFVSIHFNDSRKRGIRGFETYYHSGVTSELANRIQAKLMTIPNSANRGVRTANFRVLRMANYPAVLVECGFLSNRSEGNKARDWEYRELLADRIAEAIVEQRYGVGVYQPTGRLALQLQRASTGEAGTTSSLEFFPLLWERTRPRVCIAPSRSRTFSQKENVSARAPKPTREAHALPDPKRVPRTTLRCSQSREGKADLSKILCLALRVRLRRAR